MRRRRPEPTPPAGAAARLPEALAIGPHVPTWAPMDGISDGDRMVIARRLWRAAREKWVTAHHLSTPEAARLLPWRRPYFGEPVAAGERRQDQPRHS